MMLAQLLYQVLDWLFGFFTLALLARFAMQWTRASFRNPLGQFVVAVTDWAVVPVRRLIPSAFGFDLPTLLLAWLAQAMFLGLVFGLFATAAAVTPGAILSLALLAVVATARLAIYLLFGAVIVSALLSWINPYAPLAPVVNAIAQPFLRPLQRLIPTIGGVDLSPLVLLLVLQILLSLLSSAQRILFPLFPG